MQIDDIISLVVFCDIPIAIAGYMEQCLWIIPLAALKSRCLYGAPCLGHNIYYKCFKRIFNCYGLAQQRRLLEVGLEDYVVGLCQGIICPICNNSECKLKVICTLEVDLIRY